MQQRKPAQHLWILQQESEATPQAKYTVSDLQTWLLLVDDSAKNEKTSPAETP